MVTKDHNQEQELRHRIGLGLTAFGKLDSIMQNKSIPLRLKMKVHNECILPVITYESETWSLNKTQLHKMVITQCKMRMNNDGTNTAQQKKFKLDLLKDRCHWHYPLNSYQQAPRGRACLMAERQQVDQMCDRVVPMRPQVA